MIASQLSTRMLFAALFVMAVALLGIGYGMQYGLRLEPCPLCITQRFFIFMVGLTGAVAAIHAPRVWGYRVYGVLALVFALVGAGFSGRHLWLQSLPADQVPACGPSIDYILDTFAPLEALAILLRGTGDCAKVDWSLFGLSIPGWTLIAFVILAGTAAIALMRRTASAR